MQKQLLTAVIIDDEKGAIASLKKLAANIDFIKIIGSYTKSYEAIDEIYSLKPDILFLDIQMPGKNGFEVIQEINDLKELPYIIFITSYEKYAIRAIKQAAFDFLLKPVDEKELRATLKRIKDSIESQKARTSDKLEVLINKLKTRKKIKFNTSTGFIIIESDEIIYLQACRNYCEIYLINDRCEIVTMNMNNVSKLLPEESFFRISRYHIINMEYLQKVERRNHMCYLFAEGETYDLKISLRNAKLLEKLYESYSG